MAGATESELAVQAVKCPIIRNAYRTGDPEVIQKALAMHPPSRCRHMEQAPR